MKVGIEITINVDKMDMTRLYQGKNGRYLTMTTFLDTSQPDKFDNHGFVTHKKNEGEDKAPIIGNGKIFWEGNQQQKAFDGQPSERQQAPQQAQQQAPAGGFQQSSSQGKAFDNQKAAMQQQIDPDMDQDIPF